jgi:cell division protein FtsX
MPSRVDRTDNLLEMMARLVKILESNATVDSAQRQRITLDAITGALTLATVTTVGTVSTITGGTITTVSNITNNAGMDREQYINIAKQTYTQSIRNRLEFT